MRLLHRTDVLDLRQLGDRLGLDVDDDATGDVVDDDGLVGVRGDLLNMADDRALRRLAVVRGDDEERVDAELVRLLCELRRVCVSFVPVPATTVARLPTASTAAAKSWSFSSSDSVGLSPVVPVTTMPSEPWSTR
jgi:hypothetical protein